MRLKLFDLPERIRRESGKRKKEKKALSQARALFTLAVCPTLSEWGVVSVLREWWDK